MKKAKNLRGMFKDCKKLKVLPDISKWNVENVESMEEMFYGCINLDLGEFPDLKKWNLTKLKNIDRMFFGSSLISQFDNLHERDPQILDFLEIDDEPVSLEKTLDTN